MNDLAQKFDDVFWHPHVLKLAEAETIKVSSITLFSSVSFIKITDDFEIYASYCPKSKTFRSKFSDSSWNIGDEKTIEPLEHFSDRTTDSFIKQSKLILLSLTSFKTKKGTRSYQFLSTSTIQSRYSALRMLSKTDALKNSDLFTFLTSEKKQRDLAEEIKRSLSSSYPLEGFKCIISSMHGIFSCAESLFVFDNIEVKMSKPLDNILKAADKFIRSNTTQHLVIPPRIYSQMYQSSINIVSKWDFELVDMSFSELIDAIYDLTDTGSNNRKPAGVSRKAFEGRGNTFLKGGGAKAYITQQHFADKVKQLGTVSTNSIFADFVELSEVNEFIKKTQADLGLLLLLESGLRVEDLILTKQQEIDVFKTKTGTAFQFFTKERKISRGKLLGFVVSKHGKKAFEILCQLSDYCYLLQISKPINKEERWLFPKASRSITEKIGVKHIPGTIIIKEREISVNLNHNLKPISVDILFREHGYLDDIIVNNVDIEFLRRYTTEDSPLNSCLIGGEPWPFTPHQMRRSLAFYSAGSNLISLSSLKHQLKHNAMITTEYYASGHESLVISNLSLPAKEHKEFLATMLNDQDSINIIGRKNLINIVQVDSDSYFGGAKKHLKEFSEMIQTCEDPEKVYKDFVKDGTLRTNELPHGFCITNEVCDDFANRNFFECISCSNAFLSIKGVVDLIDRLRNAASKAQSAFNKLNFTRLAYKIEVEYETKWPNL